MTNQIHTAIKGIFSKEIEHVARSEMLEPEAIAQGLVRGTIVIPKNNGRSLKNACAIGKGTRTKVNANIGTSQNAARLEDELAKLDACTALGADTVMDLSTGSHLQKTRRAILKRSPVPVGTVPIYEIVINGIKKHGSAKKVSTDEMFAVVEEHAKDGVDFFTIHAGVTRAVIASLTKSGRILDIVSRGGAFLAEWMIENGRENPFYEQYDRLLDIAHRFDVTLSLGDGLRPGSVADATDGPQLAELITLGELQQRALKHGVQSMIEGPGHVPLHQIEANVALEKAVCHEAPFYVLGPLVTDIAPGYDHITAAIGGALAARAGADYLCYVTPSEHLRHPTIEDVREGVVASKIAAHAADIAKGIKGALERDRAMSRARSERDWKKQFKLALDPEKPKLMREQSLPDVDDVCTMCGEYCSIKTAHACLEKARRG